MQGVPGIGWSVVQKAALENSRGNCRPLVLDLWDQNQHMDRTNAFRFRSRRRARVAERFTW
jgi:2-aminoethylphosphonate-pyruvate transaminase